MSTINIAGLTPVEDPSYRYKMPRLVGKVEGRGNGIKTVLVNVVDLGLALNREAPEITKFFGCEVGAQTTYAADTERAIVNGAHRDDDLQNHLSKYIENFVLCKNCKLPETYYKIKDGLISQKCNACGSKEAVDMRHKLTAFILAQHKKAKAESSKKDKADKKKEKKEKKDKKDKKDSPAEEGVDGDGFTSTGVNRCETGSPSPSASSEKKKKSASSSKKSAKSSAATTAAAAADGTVFSFADGGGGNGNGGEGEEEDDDGEEESDLKAAEDGMARFKLWMSNIVAATGSAPTTQQVVDELRNIQTMASLRPLDRIIIFLGATFSPNIITNKEISQHTDILKALAPTPIQERHLIASFEWFCGALYPDSLLKFFPVVLKELLDEELVDEDTFLEWAADLARNEFSAEQSMISVDALEALKASAAPFITWLQEAEEDDDDDDDDDEEDDDDDDEEEDD